MPRFQSVGEGDVQAIAQAIECATPAGPYFRVSGENVHPDDIVSFQGPEESATFKLRDGRTLQHDRFAQGENGDLLYRALRVLRRPQDKSQALKPAANLYLEYDNAARDVYLLDGQGAIIEKLIDGTYSSVHDDLFQRLDPAQDVATATLCRDVGVSTAKLFDAAGNLLNSSSLTDFGDEVIADILQDDTQRAVAIGGDTAARASEIKLLRPDGTTNLLVSNGESASFGVNDTVSPTSFGATLSTSPGYGVFVCQGDMHRIPLDGSTTSSTLFVSNVRYAIAVYDGRAYFIKDGSRTVESIDITNINASTQAETQLPVSFPNTKEGGVQYATADRFHILNPSENYAYNRKTGTVATRESESSFNFTMATLDVSKI